MCLVIPVVIGGRKVAQRGWFHSLLESVLFMNLFIFIDFYSSSFYFSMKYLSRKLMIYIPSFYFSIVYFGYQGE